MEHAVDEDPVGGRRSPNVSRARVAPLRRLAPGPEAGITFGMEDSFRPWIARGELVPSLEDFCPHVAGFYLYYPSRRNLAPKLRALLEHVRQGKA